MAKQAIDKATKEMHLVTTWDRKEDALKKVAEVIKKLQGLEIEYNEKKTALADVEAMGYDYAGTTYRAGKYLYLVYPSVNGQERRRKYIGADPEKITQAMAMLNRGVLRDKLKREITSLESRVQSVGYNLDRALQDW
ncbi:MAG: hypothetical protein V4588_03950 [Pseudomonadota bacterium]